MYRILFKHFFHTCMFVAAILYTGMIVNDLYVYLFNPNAPYWINWEGKIFP